MRNLRIAFGNRLGEKEIGETVKRSLRNFFRDIAELGYALSATPAELSREIPVTGREHLEAVLARRRGAIALGAHLGNFFLVAARLAADGYPTYLLVKPPRNKVFRRLMDQNRLKIGIRTIHSKPRREASRTLAQVLRRNHTAVVTADEFRSGSGIRVPFFGRTVLARRGAATLALRTGAALLPVYLVRDGRGKLTLIIEPEIQLMRSGRINEDVAEGTLRITTWLERVIRSYPDQWNWMNVRWQESLPLQAMGREQHSKKIA